MLKKKKNHFLRKRLARCLNEEKQFYEHFLQRSQQYWHRNSRHAVLKKKKKRLVVVMGEREKKIGVTPDSAGFAASGASPTLSRRVSSVPKNGATSASAPK